jgi:hypothetical protein
VTPEEQALAIVVGLLEAQGIPYMVTGSVASSFYGRPRSTHDADVVIDPTAEQLTRFVGSIADAGFYVNAGAARRALQQRTLFNVIEVGTASKIDLIVRRDRPFSVEEFSRRRPVNFAFRSSVVLVSPEDVILSKLEWAQVSGVSERQLVDVRGILDATASLDFDYIERWVAALGLDDLWRRVSSRS